MCPQADDRSHVQILDGLGDIELVHGVDDDGGRGEEGEEEEQQEVEHHVAHEPLETSH